MKLLKSLIIVCLLLPFASCTEQLDENEAKTVVESLLHEIDEENYQLLGNYYADSFINGESVEARAEKFGKLKSALGGLVSFEVVESENLANFGEPAQVLLTYRIKRTRVPSIEKFVVIKEEGKYKVSSHGIVNE